MQVTLVAHYGPKPASLATLLRHLQKNLSTSLGRAFQLYDIDQVHATIVGLEGCRVDGGIRSKRSGKLLDFSGVVEFLRGGEFSPIHVRVGGYSESRGYPFLSRDAHPHLRSFSIQEDTAVAMGWPVENGNHPDSLDRLRRSFQQFGVRHKWHTTDEAVDNDCFLVLGRIDRDGLDDKILQAAAASIRADLATALQTMLEISRDTISFVGYVDSRLPPESSKMYGLHESDLAVKLEALYANCDSGTGQ